MKTFKITMVAALIACTMVSLANADGFKSKPQPVKVLNLSLEKATQIPGLVAAMYSLLDKEEILHYPAFIYVAEVKYNNVLYRISATIPQWKEFFNLQGVPPDKARIKSHL